MNWYIVQFGCRSQQKAHTDAESLVTAESPHCCGISGHNRKPKVSGYSRKPTLLWYLWSQQKAHSIWLQQIAYTAVVSLSQQKAHSMAYLLTGEKSPQYLVTAESPHCCSISGNSRKPTVSGHSRKPTISGHSRKPSKKPIISGHSRKPTLL